MVLLLALVAACLFANAQNLIAVGTMALLLFYASLDLQ
jgi:hypothetical protein